MSQTDSIQSTTASSRTVPLTSVSALGFAQGKVDPVEAGKQGGSTSGTGNSNSDSGTKSGNSGGSAKGEFAHGKVDPVEAGKKGGSSS
ncbi:hypothetical protein BP5796_04003 [Coleophoma crateriformis]|uniref:Uncharacterized protein n=1 Tax=Coleophoma crateriformis TaxID=565419 RepID=A0A3D8SIR4_9HELO|nr:hypothetical protein BP5796_04003 [Coleophoma crateriformis]